MRELLVITLFFSTLSPGKAQGGWSWTEKANIPFSTSNNGVAAATVNDTVFVYSFAGIDSSRSYSGIHTKSFRYNSVTDIWDTIPDLPDSLGGVIALSATTIKNKIYIVGGYHVYSNSTEISSYQIHIYHPDSNKYTLGKNIPVAIDDHVSFAYKDSLLYIITGWTSDLNPDQNTNEVQIYDPFNDQWLDGTNTPATNSYMAFGASGALVGDTIYYAGGAVNGSFSLTSSLRKGIINPSDPTQINWSVDTTNPGDKLYRAGAISINDKIFWVGGAGVPYNYDGLAYSNGSGVEPTTRILEWYPAKRKFYENSPAVFRVMDLRNITQIDKNKFIIAGGMLENQQVSNKTFLLEYDTNYAHPPDSTNDTLGIIKQTPSDILILPNPCSENEAFSIKSNQPMEVKSISILDMNGRKVKSYKQPKGNARYNPQLGKGAYIIQIQTGQKVESRKLIIR